MNARGRKILGEALELPAADRARLAVELDASLEDASPEEIERAWTLELAKRLRDVREGRVERIETRNAMTDALETIEMRVLLEDGWAWVGERRIGARAPRKIETQGIARVERYLPYRR